MWILEGGAPTSKPGRRDVLAMTCGRLRTYKTKVAQGAIIVQAADAIPTRNVFQGALFCTRAQRA